MNNQPTVGRFKVVPFVILFSVLVAFVVFLFKPFNFSGGGGQYFIYTLTGVSIEPMKGKIKTIIEYQTEPEFKFGEWDAGDKTLFLNYVLPAKELYDTEVVKHEFDALGKHLNTMYYDYLDNPYRLITPVYENKRCKEVLAIESGKGKTIRFATYESINNQETRIRVMDGTKENIVFQVRELKEKGKPVRKEVSNYSLPNSHHEYFVQYDYNTNGRPDIILAKDVSMGGKVRNGQARYEIEYLDFDEKGNWIKAVTYDLYEEGRERADDEPSFFVIRKITYHE